MTDTIAITMLILVLARLCLGKKLTKEATTKTLIFLSLVSVIFFIIVLPLLQPYDEWVDVAPTWVVSTYAVAFLVVFVAGVGVSFVFVFFRKTNTTNTKSNYYWPK